MESIPAEGQQSKHLVLIETFDPMIAAKAAIHLTRLSYWTTES
ncbi:MAG: hypothetical protein OEV57_06170 [Dehalococcoidia bacterium]|nr:hypothetical protein [Dehalococcoidia bacterium]